jgi:hypothetical protein
MNQLNSIGQLKLKKAREFMRRNLEMAERFPHHPALEEKFLQQAIDAEQKVKELESYI